MKKPRYRQLAILLSWERRLEGMGVGRTDGEASKQLRKLMDTAPSGSGIDCGTKLLDHTFTKGRFGVVTAIKFKVDYHHMNECGMYDGWTEHTITVRPCLEHGFRLTISGRDRNEIKDYLHEVYEQWLSEEMEESE